MRATGIDISTRSIVIVELKHRFGDTQITAMAEHFLPDGLIKDGRIQDIDRMAEAILECAKKTDSGNPINISTACLSVPSSSVYTHAFSFPRELKQQAIEYAIEIQFFEYFPLEYEDAAILWYVAQKSNQTQIVFVAACSRERVEELCAVAEKCSIRPSNIGLESISTAQAILPKRDKAGANMVIDMGAEVTSFNIVNANGLQHSFTLQNGSDTITERIATACAISWDEAEALKRKTSMLEKTNNQELSIIVSQLDSVVAETRRIINFFEGSHQQRVQGIYLCGGMSLITGMDQYLNEVLPVQVYRGDPFTHIKTKQKNKRNQGVCYASAIGLALSDIDRSFQRSRFNFLRARSLR